MRARDTVLNVDCPRVTGEGYLLIVRDYYGHRPHPGRGVFVRRLENLYAAYRRHARTYPDVKYAGRVTVCAPDQGRMEAQWDADFLHEVKATVAANLGRYRTLFKTSPMWPPGFAQVSKAEAASVTPDRGPFEVYNHEYRWENVVYTGDVPLVERFGAADLAAVKSEPPWWKTDATPAPPHAPVKALMRVEAGVGLEDADNTDISHQRPVMFVLTHEDVPMDDFAREVQTELRQRRVEEDRAAQRHRLEERVAREARERAELRSFFGV